MEPATPGPTRLIPYAGDVLRVLGESEAVALCELTVPPRFAGPPAHIHHGFDEARHGRTKEHAALQMVATELASADLESV